ncbi:MAG TPA: peptidase MA family metallohydrolase [Candidatus Limnocylindria bacterium]|nr:peptidase MA family metallohydrolase [Candidatus Limnocylindria bacterium]
MGRLTRWLLPVALALVVLGLRPGDAAAFEGFGDPVADSTYGEEIRFEVAFEGGAPEGLQLLVQFPGTDASLVIPVQATGDRATYVYDTSADHVTPNTVITYRWRGTVGDTAIVSEPEQIRYEDDRAGLDWRQARLGEATVHWYGDAEGQAMRFGELTAQGVARAEELLGTELAGPVDVFVYDSQEDFFGALGPGAREWTGAAAFPELRTIFMWLGGGSTDYLEIAMLHEVTHIVFHDATVNPFHEPATWLNEGIATWSELSNADAERDLVELEAAGGGLVAFEAITQQFPIDERGARLSYAQGAVFVDMVVDAYGEDAIAGMAAAYREGATEAEALEAGTGVPAEELYARFYDAFGVEAPQPIRAEPIPPSNVDRPSAGPIDPGGVDPSAEPVGEPPDVASPNEPGSGGVAADVAAVVLLAVAVATAIGAAVFLARRAGVRDAAP